MTLIGIRPSAVTEKPATKSSKPVVPKRLPARKTTVPKIDVRSLFPGYVIGTTIEHGPSIQCRYGTIYAQGRRLVLAVPDDNSPVYEAVRVILNNTARVKPLVDPPRVRENRWAFRPSDFARIADVVSPLLA